jgi:hypothetical protein
MEHIVYCKRNMKQSGSCLTGPRDDIRYAHPCPVWNPWDVCDLIAHREWQFRM